MSAPAAAMTAYARARAAVRRMRGDAQRDAPGEVASGVNRTGAAATTPSAYWTGELANIDYLSEASPLIIAKLRHHAFHITGIRPYDYRTKADRRRAFFEQRLAALRELDRDDALLVPEHPALGGFGYDIDGRLFNVDTLKFYEVLLGMERGSVLPALRAGPQPMVCEVGAGWGGFAYQFKTLFPRSTYVIVDFPELFLFSATYLGAVFPDARMVFCDGSESGANLRDADFVFVPHTRTALVESLPLDLIINMVSFQEMTDAQVRGYARMAATARCPLLYSLNRERSPYNEEIAAVSTALAGDYALREVAVLPTDYTSAMKKSPVATAKGDQSPLGYRHLVGRLRQAGAARTVLGMTLYNNAAKLPEAIDSLLAQTRGDFVLVMVDDGSTDGTESICRAYAARDPRIRYHRHAERQGMVATWFRSSVIGRQEAPEAEFFAWASDHDRWHPRWYEALVAELDASPQAVLAYPLTRRLTTDGEEIIKEPRRFDTAGLTDVRARWAHFCRNAVGAGDMVYGLIRYAAFEASGVFRPVLRPDRLLIAELTLRGEIHQVPEVLWFRRNGAASSVARQRQTLMLPGTEPTWFWWPPFMQHAAMLRREYDAATLASLGISTSEWPGMLRQLQLAYGWRHVRKTDTSTAIGRGIERVVYARKLAKQKVLRGVYHTLVAMHAALDRFKGSGRRA